MTGIYSDVGDDGICIKSGVNEDGWRVNKPTENVIIENCFVGRGHGGIVFGSEMSGGIKNVLVRNCVYDGTLMGIRLKSMRGRGGYIKDIWVRDIEMKNIMNEATHAKNIRLKNVRITTPEGPAFMFDNCESVHLDSCSTGDDATSFFHFPGEETAHISVTGTDPEERQGTFTDQRDQKIYPWVKIGNQVWMAENLAFKADTGSWVFYNDVTKDSAYFYNWATARYVSPRGWHLPTEKEWSELTDYIAENAYPNEVGLKSVPFW